MSEASGQSGNVTTLQQLLRQAINYQLTEMHVCMPGKIESYDDDTGLANVKPTLSRRFRGAVEPTEYPVVPRVPVIHPRTAKAAVRFPVEKGDLVLLVFGDRNLENWIASSGTEPREVRDVRRHDLSDAFAILGGYPALAPSPSKSPGALSIEVEPGTKVAIGNGTVELIDILDQMVAVLEDAASGLITALTAHVHTGGTGTPTVPFTPFQAQLTALKELLDQIKA